MTHGSISNRETEQAYQQLLLAFSPRTIKSEADYAQVQAQVDQLIDKGDLSIAEQEYLDLLGMLIYAYEEQTENKEDYKLRGIALIKGLIDLYDLQQKDLTPIFKTESIVSDILKGKRRLTTEHIDGLATFFKLPHSLFFEPDNNRSAHIEQARRTLNTSKEVNHERTSALL